MNKIITFILILAVVLSLILYVYPIFAYTQISNGILLNLSASTNNITFNETKNSLGQSVFNFTFTTIGNQSFNVTFPKNITFPELQNKLNLSEYNYYNSTIYSNTTVTLCGNNYFNNLTLINSIIKCQYPSSGYSIGYLNITANYIYVDNNSKIVTGGANAGGSSPCNPDSGSLTLLNATNITVLGSIQTQGGAGGIGCNFNDDGGVGYDILLYANNLNINGAYLNTTGGSARCPQGLSHGANGGNGGNIFIYYNNSFSNTSTVININGGNGASGSAPCGGGSSGASGSINYNLLNALSIFGYSQNPYLNISNTQVWNYTGTFNQLNNQTSDLSSAISSALSVCIPDSNGLCNITFTIGSNSSGIIQISAQNYTYYVNLTPLFTSQFSTEYKEAGVEVNHTTIMNHTSQNISNNLSLSGFYLNYTGSAPTSCKVNETSGAVDSSLKSCNLTMNFNKEDKFGNFSIFWSKGNKITKTDKGSVRDINSTVLFANSSGWNYNTTWYYWNTTFELNDTDTINYTNVIWNNYLAGANFSYAQNISNGAISQLNHTEKLNVTTRFRTKVMNVTETIVDVGALNYEKDVTLVPPIDIDGAFLISYYNNIFVNVTLSTGFTGYRLYKWSGSGWDDVTGDPTHIYNFTASTGSATFYNPSFSSSSVIYYSVASTTPSSSPSPGGGGGGNQPQIIVGPSGNWTLLKTNAFLGMSVNSSITSFFTIDNRKDVSITKINITCPTESDTNGLCKYVKYGEMIITGGVPMFQTYQVLPGQTADISYTISLPSDIDLKPFNTYDFVLMVDINNEKRPFTVTIWYLPGGEIISGAFTWFSGSSFRIPNWAIAITIVIIIIILFVLALGRMTRPKKWFKLKKIKYF